MSALRRAPVRVENSPDPGRREDFIRANLSQLEPESVDVLLESALFLQFADKIDGLIRGPGAELGDDIDQRALDILSLIHI